MMSSSSFLRDRGIFEATATAVPPGQARSPRSRGSANGVKIRRVAKTNIPNTNNVPTNDNFDDDIENAGTVIVSVVENRAREICISKYDTTCGSFVEIYLLTDSHSYAGMCHIGTTYIFHCSHSNNHQYPHVIFLPYFSIFIFSVQKP